MSDEEWGSPFDRPRCLTFAEIREASLRDLSIFVRKKLGPIVQEEIRSRMSLAGDAIEVQVEFVLREVDRSSDWALAVADYARLYPNEFLRLLLKSLPIQGFFVAPIEHFFLAEVSVAGDEPSIRFCFSVAADKCVVADREQIAARNEKEETAFVDEVARVMAEAIINHHCDENLPVYVEVEITPRAPCFAHLAPGAFSRQAARWESQDLELEKRLVQSPRIKGYKFDVSGGIRLDNTSGAISFVCEAYTSK
mgnify:CR=1 FL=1